MNTTREQKATLLWAGVFMSTAIILGAMGAHALKSVLAPEDLHAYETAVQYQLYHGLALLGLGVLAEGKIELKLVRILLIIGTLLFSGSIYLLLIFGQLQLFNLQKIIGPVTPIGGLCLIVGWLVFSVRIARLKV